MDFLNRPARRLNASRAGAGFPEIKTALSLVVRHNGNQATD